MIEWSRLQKSFKYAFQGVGLVFKHEQSFRIQVMVAIAVLLASVFLRISTFEFIIVVLLMGSVMILELINSIFERIVDTFKPRIHPAVRDIKDIMAATVLISSVVAAILGIIIFFPYFIALF
ncbi:diacylglycerol kinase family protein [Patescibacteria group bacterium]